MNKHHALKIGGLVLVTFLVLTSWSCKKKKWEETLPVDVNYSSSSDTITFPNGAFIIDTLLFYCSDQLLQGSRIQADDISLDLNQNIVLDFMKNTGTTVSFDIPQGTYTKMNFGIKLQSASSNSVYIIGKYHFANGTVYHVTINLDNVSLDMQQLLDTDNATSILIEKNTPRTLGVFIDPQTLFSGLSVGSWTSAAVTSNQLLVSATDNTSIYGALKAKINASLQYKFIK